MNKNAKTGFTLRVVAGFVVVITMPFIITNPSNPIALVLFAFGNFLMVIGGLLP
tara:strand:+ start:559 stop:720 length:162 start_codon:yes stop_codon:yes gene_type:complete